MSKDYSHANIVRFYAETIRWICADVWAKFGWRLVVHQLLLAAGMIGELGATVAIIRQIGRGEATLPHISLLLMGLLVATGLVYWMRTRIIFFAIDYERLILLDLISRSRIDLAGNPIMGRMRQVSAVLRQLLLIPIWVGTAAPALAAMFWIAPLLTLATLAVLVATALPLYQINRSTSSHYSRMTALNAGAQKARDALIASGERDPQTLNETFMNSALRQNQTSYFHSLRAGEASRLVLGIAFVVILGLILATLLSGRIDLHTVVIYLVVLRFFVGHFQHVANGVTAMNRYYKTLNALMKIIQGRPVPRAFEGGEDTEEPSLASEI